MALWCVIFMVYEISRVHLHHLSTLFCTLLIITALAFSLHVLFARSTSPWVVGVHGDPWAIWIPFSLQNCFMSSLSNSLLLSLTIFFG